MRQSATNVREVVDYSTEYWQMEERLVENLPALLNPWAEVVGDKMIFAGPVPVGGDSV